jgi:hypothetical protein
MTKQDFNKLIIPIIVLIGATIALAISLFAPAHAFL